MQDIKQITPSLSVSSQLKPEDFGLIASMGFHAIINNRPDGEAEDQPTAAVMEAAARRHGLEYRNQPVISGRITDENVADFTKLLQELKGPVLAFCRTGTRSSTLWALSEAPRLAPDAILKATGVVGYNLEALRGRLEARWAGTEIVDERTRDLIFYRSTKYDVVIVGGGAAGIATAASLLKKRADLSIAIIEPSDQHDYQPGWTLVGANVVPRESARRAQADYMPKGAKWIRAAAAAFEPDKNCVVLEDGGRVGYAALVVCPGIKLNWAGIEGLQDSLGRSGVTCNYHVDMSSYTWELVRSMEGGRALFTQPPMPIKGAGAPQNAMYLTASTWERMGRLDNMEIEFNTAAGVLFGVKDFVPGLMAYVERYGAKLAFGSNLTAVDGPGKKAYFEIADADGGKRTVAKDFDVLHVVPPQMAPDFIRNSPLADAAGWVEVDNETLRHKRFGNVFSLGDVCSAPNAKTAAAVRKQSPVVVRNLLAFLDGKGPRTIYDGYGACPFTVEIGKVIMAEFGYGGKLLPTLPLTRPIQPTYVNWLAKTKLMPFLYYDLMLRGHEWLATPKRLAFEPTAHDVIATCDFKDG